MEYFFCMQRGCTDLMFAATAGDLEAANNLINSGVKLDTTNKVSVIFMYAK